MNIRIFTKRELSHTPLEKRNLKRTIPGTIAGTIVGTIASIAGTIASIAQDFMLQEGFHLLYYQNKGLLNSILDKKSFLYINLNIFSSLHTRGQQCNYERCDAGTNISRTFDILSTHNVLYFILLLHHSLLPQSPFFQGFARAVGSYHCYKTLEKAALQVLSEVLVLNYKFIQILNIYFI